MRTAFLILAQKRHMAAIHSASLFCDGKAILFSGASGAGKSTHTSYWKKLFDVTNINGDLNLIGVDKTTKTPMCYGIPWCGTSDIYNNGTYPLGAIVLLKHGTKNLATLMDGSEKILSLSERMISPTWNESLFSVNINIASDIGAAIPVVNYSCTKKAEAAKILKGFLDKTMK